MIIGSGCVFNKTKCHPILKKINTLYTNPLIRKLEHFSCSTLVRNNF